MKKTVQNLYISSFLGTSKRSPEQAQKKRHTFWKINKDLHVNLGKISTFRLFWVFKKESVVVRKRASHVLKKLFFFQNLLNFFQKSSIVGAKQLQIFEKFMFFRFYFFIKLDPCSRRESNRFFHKKVVSIVGIKQKKNPQKLIKFWRFWSLSNKKAARVGTKKCTITPLFLAYFHGFWYLKTLHSRHKTKTIFWKKKF